MLHLKRLPANYQILAIAPSPPDQPILADELATLELPADVDLEREVILFGGVPMWVYGALIARCRSAPWIGCYAALEKKAIVIHSRVAERSPGDEVAIALDQPPGLAILIGGPPNSGKSVLSNALRKSLLKHRPDLRIYLHRANWDGEGNWSHEANNRELIQRLIREYERRIHELPDAAQLIQPYFNYHARAVTNLRDLVDVVLVDVGGKTQAEKLPLVQQCTDYLLISRDPALLEDWHPFCQPHLNLLAVIHSVRQECLEVKQTTPWLELVAGVWEQGKTLSVPDQVVQCVVQRQTAYAAQVRSPHSSLHKTI
jgi:CRISPR-associated protein Csx3